MPRKFDWTEERLELAMKLARENLPASAIGAQLGTTRNSIVGKLHRLGMKLTSQPPRPPVTTGTKASRAAAQRIHEARVKAPVTLAPAGALGPTEEAARAPLPDLRRPPAPLHFKSGLEPQPVNLVDLREHHCRAPLWQKPKPAVEEMMYCGRPADNGPYCARHREIFCISVSALPRRRAEEAVA